MLKSFKNEKEKVTRDYLHIVMHCIYRHMFVPTKFDRDIWNLACDITIENIITDLGLKSTTCKCESKQAEDMFFRLKKQMAEREGHHQTTQSRQSNGVGCSDEQHL